MSPYLGSEQQTLELLREYADEIRRATPAGTELIVLPEKVGRVSEKVLPEADALFNSAAAATSATIDIGLVRGTSSGAFNSSRVYSPNGAGEVNYDKHHLLLGVEPEQPGNPDERVLLDLQSTRAGLQICKDMDFPQLSRGVRARRRQLAACARVGFRPRPLAARPDGGVAGGREWFRACAGRTQRAFDFKR